MKQIRPFFPILLLLGISPGVSSANPGLIKAKEVRSSKICGSIFLKDAGLDFGLSIVVQRSKETTNLLSDSKLGSYANYQRSLNTIAKSDKDMRELTNLFRADELEFGMAVSSAERSSVSKSGFKNAYQTDKANEPIMKDYMADRKNVEAIFLGLTEEEFAKIPIHLRPKYGYVLPPLDHKSVKPSLLIEDYGDDLFIFHKDKLSSRTTFTIGDSLNKELFYHGPVKHIREAVPVDLTNKHWERRYLPWEYRELAVPFHYRAFKETRTLEYRNPKKGIDKELYEDWDDPIYEFNQDLFDLTNPNLAKTKERFPELENYNPFYVGPRGNYTELQFHGDLNLSHVKQFVFTKEPPSGEFLAKLKQHKIQILDGRNPDKIVPYQP